MVILYDYRVKIALLAVLALLAILRYFLGNEHRPRTRRWLAIAAAPLALLAVLSFNAHAQFWNRWFLNNHDVYHYYFGAKYSDELGYDRLYWCTVVALDEIDPKLHQDVKTIRSLTTYEHWRKTNFLKKPQPCKRHFTTQRWNEFKRDLNEFRKGRISSWGGVLGDKGYNPSPVWNMVGRFVAQHIPLQPPLVFNLIGVLDLLLLALAFLLAFLAFGWWGPALGLLYLAGCFELTRTHIRGAFLRLDWLACLVGALAALKLQRQRLAGALLGYATMVRIFPALFLFGPLVCGLQRWWAERRLPAASRRLFGSFLATCLLLFGASVVVDGGLARWTDFASKMRLHTQDICTTRIGLDYVLGYRGEIGDLDLRDAHSHGHFRPEYVKAKQEVIRSMRWPRALVTGLVLGLLALGLRRRDDVVALALSFPAVFCLVNPTFYYYCLLLPVVIAAASRPDDRPMLVILVATAAAEISFHLIPLWIGFEILQHALYSAIVGALALITLWALRRWPAPETEVAAGSIPASGTGGREPTPALPAGH